MTFLSPVFLWGLATAAIPIIIHLISLRHTKEMEFSSVRFLDKMKHESIRNLTIKQWLLVLLRTLIIVALVLMLARPTTKGLISSTMVGDVNSKAIIIIDNSASMSLQTSRESNLEKVQVQSKTLIKKLDENAVLEIYQTNPLKLIYTGQQNRMQSINNAINIIPQAVTADRIWAKTLSVIQETEQEELNKECFIFSDFQTLPDSNFIATLQEEYTDWKLYLIDQEKVVDNISIQEVFPVSQIKLKDHLIKINTIVANDGNVEKRNVPIELYLNQERVGQVVTAFDPQRTKEFLFQAYPGKSGIIRGKIVIPDDDFALDNVQTFEISIPERISCSLVGRSVEDIYLLENALRSISGANEYVTINRKIVPQIDKLFLDDTDVLILHRTQDIAPQAVENIQRFMERGGGLIWVADYENNIKNASIISALKLPNFIRSIRVENNSFYSVLHNDRKHALFADLQVRRMKDEFPEVYAYAKVRPHRDHNVVLTLNSMDPFLIYYRLIGGQVYYFTSPIGLGWNDFALRGLFVPMLHRMLILLATDESNTLPVVAGEPKMITLPMELINSQWAVYTPAGKRSLLIPDYNRELLVVENTDNLGSYEVYADDKFFVAFSTTLDPNERPNLWVNGQTLVDLIGVEQTQYIGLNENIADSINELRYGTALWRQYLLCAIILMLIESVIGRPNLKTLKTKATTA